MQTCFCRYDLFAIVLFFCFFFKQKTAYEMRISDWSSDVCSSDLLSPEFAAIELGHLEAVGYPFSNASPTVPKASLTKIAPHLEKMARLMGWREIGRASCRERVCQYV